MSRNHRQFKAWAIFWTFSCNPNEEMPAYKQLPCNDGWPWFRTKRAAEKFVRAHRTPGGQIAWSVKRVKLTMEWNG